MLAARQRGSCMVPMWFRNLTGTTLYRKGFWPHGGMVPAWFRCGSDVVPHFKRKQIVAIRHLLAARLRVSCMVPMWFRNLTGTTRVQLPIMTFLNPRRISLLSVPDRSEILPRIRNWHTGRRPVRLDRYFGVIPQVSLGSRAEECAGRHGSDEACLWQWVVGWRV